MDVVEGKQAVPLTNIPALKAEKAKNRRATLGPTSRKMPWKRDWILQKLRQNSKYLQQLVVTKILKGRLGTKALCRKNMINLERATLHGDDVAEKNRICDASIPCGRHLLSQVSHSYKVMLGVQFFKSNFGCQHLNSLNTLVLFINLLKSLQSNTLKLVFSHTDATIYN